VPEGLEQLPAARHAPAFSGLEVRIHPGQGAREDGRVVRDEMQVRQLSSRLPELCGGTPTTVPPRGYRNARRHKEDGDHQRETLTIDDGHRDLAFFRADPRVRSM
jgi:hypothetical protein